MLAAYLQYIITVFNEKFNLESIIVSVYSHNHLFRTVSQLLLKTFFIRNNP